VIESHLDKNIGPVATVLVQAGTLKKNDVLVVNGEIYGKVRAMKDYHMKQIEEAPPSTPAQIIGFKVAPEVGDVLDVASGKDAKKIDFKQKRQQQSSSEKVNLTDDLGGDDDDKKQYLNIVIKSDVLGSLEAIIGSLQKIKNDDVGIKIIGKGLGNINENDIQKAEATGGALIGFNVQASPSAEDTIREKKLDFQKFSIIYDLIDWVKGELEKMLGNKKQVIELGKFKVQAIFRTEKRSMIVGGVVSEGTIKPQSFARIVRDDLALETGEITQCQIGKQKVKSVSDGTECGMTFEGKGKIEVGDILEVYREESLVQTLD